MQRESFLALERAAIALRKGDYEVAEREGMRTGALEVQTQKKMAACLESLGG